MISIRKLTGLWVVFEILSLSGCQWTFPLASGMDTGTDTDTGSDAGSDTVGEVDTDTETGTGCPVGYKGDDCSFACESTKLKIASCTNALFNCSMWIDGDYTKAAGEQCADGEENCFAIDYDFDLLRRYYVNRIRFLSDWYSKRPGTWDLLASDDGVNFSFVMSARSNHAPWNCVQDEICTEAVPEECCPGGSRQDTTSVGKDYPKWDDVRFTGAVARYWRFRIKTTDDLYNLTMRELELYGNGCLGSRCEVSPCKSGVCTEEAPAQCMCAGCEPKAWCTSAFTGSGPGCTTPE